MIYLLLNPTFTLTVLGFILCRIFFILYQLVKLYKNKADNIAKKKKWKSLLFILIIIPAIFWSFYNFKPSGVSTPYQKGYERGALLAIFLISLLKIYVIGLLTSYTIPGFIAVFSPKEGEDENAVSPNLLGVFILCIWVPINIIFIKVGYGIYKKYNGQSISFPALRGRKAKPS